jgi:acetate kinase
MNVLTINVGAVTLKVSVVDEHDNEVAVVHADPWDDADTDVLDQLRHQLDEADTVVDAVGHRIVHGGGFDRAAVVDDGIESHLRDLAPLAPLHQHRTLDAIGTFRRMFDAVPHVACFDTTFHATLGRAARTYALPAEWRERWQLRRFGFHGLSHAHVAGAAPAITGADPDARIVSCHLGSGVSICAIEHGRSVDTTMGATPLEGPVMLSRSGTVDPGIIIWLIDHVGLDASHVAAALRERSGLVGLAGGSGDMREILDRVDRGDERALLAFEVYAHRLRAAIGSMVAPLGGIDVLAFTGGVGQNLAAVRHAVAAPLAFLGVAIDDDLNDSTSSDEDISAPAARCATAVVATAEHLTIARETRACLSRTQT